MAKFFVLVFVVLGVSLTVWGLLGLVLGATNSNPSGDMPSWVGWAFVATVIAGGLACFAAARATYRHSLRS